MPLVPNILYLNFMLQRLFHSFLSELRPSKIALLSFYNLTWINFNLNELKIIIRGIILTFHCHYHQLHLHHYHYFFINLVTRLEIENSIYKLY